MASPKESAEDIARAQRMLDEAAARKMAKRAERQKFWDEYNKQLSLAVPHQGGARHKKIRGRVLRYN